MTNPDRQLPLGVRSHSPARSCELMAGGRIRKNEAPALPMVGWAWFVPDMPDSRKLSRTFKLWRWAFWAGMPAVLVFSLMLQVPNLPTTGWEVLQFFIPYRFAEWVDLPADALGLALGWGLARLSDSRLRISSSTGANNMERGPRPREKS